MTLIVATIMLVLITLVVLSAYTISASDLKTVNNVQVRNEATAAANQAIEQLVATNFTSSLGSQTMSIDIDKDGTSEYSVVLATPTCIRSKQVDTCQASGCGDDPTSACGQSYAAGGSGVSGSGTCGSYLTDWDIKATVTHVPTGASVVVRQGVRVPLDSTSAQTACP
jgi:hypothetical protein